ncbi:MAG TPA: PHP domain-containing protein [Acidimicrobiales bacterium]|nr:PHP domain-containing protein [Acidimicrobiales bacterium]
MLDYHVHLWPHGERARPVTVDELADYCRRAAEAGVGEIALTEHLFRFREARELLGPFWETAGDPKLAASMARYWDEHCHAGLDEYVSAVNEAKDAGLPVVLGLEVDHYPGLMHKVGALLSGLPFDVLLGSVHWIGAWLFDWLEDPESVAEWGRRGVDAVWDAYTECLEELADSGVCDVLAHPDLAKVAGHRPAAPAEFHARIVEAAARTGMAAEASSAGWRKPAAEAYPAPDLLGRLRAAGVPLTTASDTHGPLQLAHRFDELRRLVEGAGYRELVSFRSRQPRPVAL